MGDEYEAMCPNCVTPWKCNGPHEWPSEAPVETPKLGSRYNKDKAELSMVLEANKALEGVAKVLMMGRDKYSRGNWLKGLEHMGIVDCLMRHLTAHTAGENLDAESGLPHVDHVLANALFLSQMYHTRSDLDNRVVATPQAPEVEEQARALVERIDSLTNHLLLS